MKLLAIVSAGLIATAATLPVAAGAQEHRERVVTRTSVHTERHGYRPHRTRRVCSVQYRHHQRVRVCRTVRY